MAASSRRVTAPGGQGVHADPLGAERVGGARDRRAVARYAGLTGAPDESGAKRREQGLGWVIMDFTPIVVISSLSGSSGEVP